MFLLIAYCNYIFFFEQLVTFAMNGPSLFILSELCSWYRQTLSLVSYETTFGNHRNLNLNCGNDRWKRIHPVLMQLR
jgi:hypothetical protein